MEDNNINASHTDNKEKSRKPLNESVREQRQNYAF
jgi:hypothetical protein